VVIPETMQLLHGAIHVVLSSEYVFMMPVTAYVNHNPYAI